jgi:hypothetical protein
MKLGKWLIKKITRTLEPELQDAVVGDVTELKMPDRRAVYELLGLVLRRQAPLWKTWQPWLALLGIVGPVGVLLSKISVGVVSDIWRQALVYWRYGVPYSSGLTEAQEFETLVFVSLAIICWSWVGGFVLGTLSGDTLYVNGTLFCLVWFCLCGPLFVLIYAVRLLLNALHLVPLRVVPLRNFSFVAFTFFAMLPPILEALLFLLPSLAGMRQARRGRKLGMQGTLLLAATVAILTALVTWIGGWRQIALEKWSEGTWNPGGLSWQERLVPLLVVSWPVLYLLVMLVVQHRDGKSKPLIA